MSLSSGMALDFDNGGREVTVGPDDPEVAALHGLPDPESDPQAFNAISAAVLADDTEDVVIEGPPSGEVRLLAGYVDDHGTRWTDVVIRELRGRDEEALERAVASGDLARYIDAICKAGVVSIGPVTEARDVAKALDTLLVGDRDLLVMQVRRLAYGDTQELDVRCPFCTHEFTVEYSYSEDVPLKQFAVADRAQRLFDVDLPSGRVAHLRLVDGRAQRLVYTPENAKKTEAELNTLLLTELLDTLDGIPVRGPGPVLDLPMRDRRALLRYLIDKQPGPQYGDVKQECSNCAREFPLVMTVREMFRDA